MKCDTIFVTKASGEVVAFDQEKFLRSLKDAGASNQVADKILSETISDIQPKATTKSIYRRAFKLLKTHSRLTAAKYNLKRAIMSLGPSGYPFEQLMGAIFERKGYTVSVGVTLKGHCVNHEVDVIAENDHELILMECKFHNQAGHKNDVKMPLYVYSRFLDVQKGFEAKGLYFNKKIQYCLATNTRFTSDAIQYGECNEMKLLAWDYPSSSSLRDLVQQTRLHPLSCLTTLSQKVKTQLFDKKLITCSEIFEKPTELEGLGLSYNKQKQVLSEIENLLI